MLTTLPTPPDMRVRIRRFNEDEQVRPRGSYSRLVSRATPLRHHPVGLVNLWSARLGSSVNPGLLSCGGSLATSRLMALPCSSLFGPSRLRWIRRIGTTAAADFCLARRRFPGDVPTFRPQMPTCRSKGRLASRLADLPGQEHQFPLHKLTLYLIDRQAVLLFWGAFVMFGSLA